MELERIFDMPKSIFQSLLPLVNDALFEYLDKPQRPNHPMASRRRDLMSFRFEVPVALSCGQYHTAVICVRGLDSEEERIAGSALAVSTHAFFKLQKIKQGTFHFDTPQS